MDYPYIHCPLLLSQRWNVSIAGNDYVLAGTRLDARCIVHRSSLFLGMILMHNRKLSISPGLNALLRFLPRLEQNLGDMCCP